MNCALKADFSSQVEIDIIFKNSFKLSSISLEEAEILRQISKELSNIVVNSNHALKRIPEDCIAKSPSPKPPSKGE